MCLRNTPTRYGTVARFFHVTIATLVVIMLSVGFFMDDFPANYQGTVYNLHKLTGVLILVLMVLRLLWALTNVKPALPADTKPWERIAEHAVHGFLYLSLIAMPLVGWIGASAAGRPPMLGSFALALPVPQDGALVEWMFDVHEWLAFFIIGLLVLHIAAALYHHFIKKDDVFRRMFM